MAGGIISFILLYSIYRQVGHQLVGIDHNAWRQTGPPAYLAMGILLMFVNVFLEGSKWYLLSRTVVAVSYGRAFASYLAGIAFSIITPNRIGEYPGRILYLGNNAYRYIAVAISGISAQLLSLYIFGICGLVYYNIFFPALIAKAALALCLISVVIMMVIYWRFDIWLPLISKIKFLRRFSIYGRLLNNVIARKRLLVLGMSLLRYLVFTAQYLFLLRWMNVIVPADQGFCMAALFFWLLGVIPSIALTELGVRGSLSLYLFHHFSNNTLGILAATMGIWLLNLILPSIIGSLLIMKMKLLR